ncbi:hypothetical protein MW887_006389 [Aspergillus wentii]|nr:hypothetical protein MW887_006389 [Aspergillus wentii]
MTVAAPPPVAPSVHENGLNGAVPGHVNMNLPRFHPIAMNPNQMPPEAMMQNHHHFRPFPPPPMQEQAPPSGPPQPVNIDHIENRLRQLEQEEAARMAARGHLLAIRKREDEEFRRVTEHAEAEEEELRRQRKRMKRESMGLGLNGNVDSPPLRPTPPRRLSETNAATTLAFFKQQSPPEPRPIPTPVQMQPHSHPHPHPHSIAHPHPHQHQHQHPHPHSHPQAHPHPHPQPHPQPHPIAHSHPHPPPPHHHITHDPSGAGSIRRKQKYTIKNVEAWGERHGRPAAHDPSGRALWKRPSDGSLVYLTCPVPGCGKADFVTLHGFMCHLTKKHKDRSLGSQSRALEVCGIVYDPNAPLPPVANSNRESTEESRLESAPTDPEGYPQEMDYSSASEDEADGESAYKKIKTESTERPMPAPQVSLPAADESSPAPKTNGSTKQTISSIIDRNPDIETRDNAAPMLPPNDTAARASPERTELAQERPEHSTTPKSEREHSEPSKEAVEAR